jgi:hypothetical protein
VERKEVEAKKGSGIHFPGSRLTRSRETGSGKKVQQGPILPNSSLPGGLLLQKDEENLSLQENSSLEII